MLVRDDTIVALSTPAGRGAIAVVRLSGRTAHHIGRQLVTPWPDMPRRVTRCTLRDARDEQELDRALVTRFDAPRSYTGEPMVEIACHGGVAVPAAVLEAIIALGARQAEPGEFTQRAVLNGKLDLLQAEAVGDLIDARTHALRRTALRQLDGGLSRALADLRERMLHVEALLAYDIDFPEEDDGPISHATIEAATREACAILERLLATVPLGEIARDGALVVIAGPPNAGKSALFNALLGETRALVTPVPGTTRDAIEARVESGRWPLRLVDTAGLRETSDLVERLGIEVSERHIGDAHLVLVCGETTAQLAASVERVAALGSAPRIAVLTKADDTSGDALPDGADGIDGIDGVEGTAIVSAATRRGLDQLLAEVHAVLERYVGDVHPELPIVVRARHRQALEAAARELAAFLSLWSSRALPASVAAIHVRSATHHLDELIGSVDVEDVLERVFRTFCVGK